MRRIVLSLIALATLVLDPGVVVPAGGSVMKKGAVDLKSIGALEFGPPGVLFVADPEAARVHAVQLDLPAGPATSPAKVEDLDSKIAALLGVGVRDVFIKDLAAHRPSGQVFLSVMRGKGKAQRAALVRVSGEKLNLVSLDAVPHATVTLPNAPAEDAELYRWRARTLTVTDLEYVDGQLYIAGLSNEEFASKLHRIPFPFGGEVQTTSLEIYHGAHGVWETKAPIFSFDTYELDGKSYLLAGYLCTPLVSFPVESLRTGSKLRGKTIAELGWGNIPADMLAFRSEGEDYILINNTTRGAMKVRTADVTRGVKGKGIETKVGAHTGLEILSVPLGHLVQIDLLDEKHVVYLARSPENGSLLLETRDMDWM